MQLPEFTMDTPTILLSIGTVILVGLGLSSNPVPSKNVGNLRRIMKNRGASLKGQEGCNQNTSVMQKGESTMKLNIGLNLIKVNHVDDNCEIEMKEKRILKW